MAGPKKSKTAPSKADTDKEMAKSLFQKASNAPLDAATIAEFSVHVKTWHPEIASLAGYNHLTERQKLVAHRNTFLRGDGSTKPFLKAIQDNGLTSYRMLWDARFLLWIEKQAFEEFCDVLWFDLDFESRRSGPRWHCAARRVNDDLQSDPSVELTPEQCAETGALFVIQPQTVRVPKWTETVNHVAKALSNTTFSDVDKGDALPYAYDFKNHTAIYTNLTYWLGPLCCRGAASYDTLGRNLKTVKAALEEREGAAKRAPKTLSAEQLAAAQPLLPTQEEVDKALEALGGGLGL